MPIVSPREISEQPTSQSCSATNATFVGGTIPSTGHPTNNTRYVPIKLEIKIVFYHITSTYIYESLVQVTKNLFTTIH